jgi:hypothetical protein
MSTHCSITVHHTDGRFHTIYVHAAGVDNRKADDRAAKLGAI